MISSRVDPSIDTTVYLPKDSSCRPYVGKFISAEHLLRFSLSEADIWRTIIAWVICKQEELERNLLRKKRDHDKMLFKLEQRKRDHNDNVTLFEKKKTSTQERMRSPWTSYSYFEEALFEQEGQALEQWARALEEETQALERETRALEEETRALEMIIHWVNGGAFKRAEFKLDHTKPTHIEQHTMELLELMEQEYWLIQHPTSPRGMSVLLPKKIFKTMRKEIPKLIGEHRRFGIRDFTIETKFSTTLDRILRLSSWTPSSTHNKRLHELLRKALLMLNDLGDNDLGDNDLGDNEEYHGYLRDFTKQHTALCAFTLGNSDLITTKDSGTTAELCKNLRRLAQNLGKIASTKGEQYQKLYERFIAHKEDLSHWLDSAGPGQGRSLVDSFTNSLKDMASNMRQEADFWNSQSNQFHRWPDIRQIYGCAIDAMPPFRSGQLDDHRSSTTPSIHDSVTQNAEPEPQRVPQAAQRVSATFAHLQKLRGNATQAFLVKTENSISKRLLETRGYLEFVVDVADQQFSQPSGKCIPKVIVRLAEKALCIMKRWNKLQRKVKYLGSILSIFSKPCQTLPKFELVSGISRDDFLACMTTTPDVLIHPYLIEFELCLRDMWHHYLSRTHFWAGINLDPATFASFLPSLS